MTPRRHTSEQRNEILFADGLGRAQGVEMSRARRDDLVAVLADPQASSLQLGDAYFQYVDGLPRPAVSRDPYTGVVIEMPIDTFGLDGPFWDREGPARPTWARPWTLTAVTGAMRLADTVEQADHIVMPGPDRPYVLPRLLQGSGRAVLSQVDVGRHTGWLIMYFHAEPAPPAPRANDWGSIWHHYVDHEGELVRVHADERYEPMDLDLGRWMDVGRLVWIAPDDQQLTLRDGRDGCPYLQLTGHGQLQGVREGKVIRFPGRILPLGPDAGVAPPTGGQQRTSKVVRVRRSRSGRPRPDDGGSRN